MDNGTENTAFEPLTPPFSGFESVFAWLACFWAICSAVRSLCPITLWECL